MLSAKIGGSPNLEKAEEAQKRSKKRLKYRIIRTAKLHKVKNTARSHVD
jgi:hypothetical protein